MKQGNHTDLVGAIMSISRDLRLMYVHSVQSFIWNRMVSERVKRMGRSVVVGDLVMGRGCQPTAVTEVTLGKYSIFDVCMPMPGYEVKSPAGPVGELYQEVLASQAFNLLDAEAFQPKTKGLWDLPGAYRHILVLPRDVQYSTGHYDELDAPISKDSGLTTEGSGKYKAVCVSFSLPSSAYATMALREIMDLHDHQ